MLIEERFEGNICIISISGRMNTLSSKEVEAKLDDIINDKFNIILNLAGVDYVSSVGLRTLIAAYKKQKLNHGQFGLIFLRPFVENVFKITGLSKILPIYLTEEAAIQRITYIQGYGEGKTSMDNKGENE
ncbi:MAG: STAS domain-containing protein [Methanotrichaceae archaeon]|jgi:anti-anti-sigma factor